MNTNTASYVIEAIAAANAELNNVDLPNYDRVMNTLKDLLQHAEMYAPANNVGIVAAQNLIAEYRAKLA